MELSKRKAALLAAAALTAGLLCGVAVAGNPHGTAPGQQTTSSAAGVKPSNNTSKDQTCTTGGGEGSSATCQSGTYPGKADASKRYGNGKTAAQIANGKGAPAGTPIYGPGNSQPHKICGRDVHAYKGASDKKCPSGTSSTSSASRASSTATGSTAGTTGTGTGTGTGTSSSNPSASSGVLGSSHTLSKPVGKGAKPAHATLGTASFTG
jgi:hypothetical protein